MLVVKKLLKNRYWQQQTCSVFRKPLAHKAQLELIIQLCIIDLRNCSYASSSSPSSSSHERCAGSFALIIIGMHCKKRKERINLERDDQRIYKKQQRR